MSDVEEHRLAAARVALPGVTSRYDAALAPLRAYRGPQPDVQTVVDAADTLWQMAVDDARDPAEQYDDRCHDDRALYWARIALRDAVRRLPGAGPELLAIVERRSRGFSAVRFPGDMPVRVLVTGFDPFHLDEEIGQSNPSGLAALALDGRTLEVRGRNAHVEAVIFPVRFADFDAGLVEEVLTPWLRDGDLTLLLTVSMGRDAFDLERFPGRRRSAPVPDNLNRLTGASDSDPRVPSLAGMPLDGPEFVEFTLPAEAMIGPVERWSVRDNRSVTTLERGMFVAPGLAALAGQTAVLGSGGGYLSNEIAYRALRLRALLGAGTAVGHLHTPALKGYDCALEAAIVRGVESIIERALAVLPPTEG